MNEFFMYNEILIAFDDYLDECERQGVEPAYRNAAEWWENLE